jgi:hypothetical protein
MDNDFIKRFERLEERVRKLEIRLKSHTETKTFLVPGSISTSMYVPPFWVGMDPDGDHPEVKRIYAYRGVLRAGTCTVSWLINGVQIGPDHDVTTVANEFEVLLDPTTYPAANVQDGDTIRPQFTAASADASDFSGAVYMVTQAA